MKEIKVLSWVFWAWNCFQSEIIHMLKILGWQILLPDTDEFLKPLPCDDRPVQILKMCWVSTMRQGCATLWGISYEQGQSCPQGSGERYSATRGSWALIPPHQDIGGIPDQKWPGRIFWSLHFLIFILCCPLIWPCFCLRAEAICSAFLVSHLWLLKLCFHHSPDFISCAYTAQLYLHCSSLFCPCLPWKQNMKMQLQNSGNRLLLSSVMPSINNWHKGGFYYIYNVLRLCQAHRKHSIYVSHYH